MSIGEVDAWDAVQLTRRSDRPGVRELLRYVADDVVWLHGESTTSANALVVALTSLLGTSCLLVGQDRRSAAGPGRLGPAALRHARSAMRTAEQLRLPLVCVLDTPGADLSVAAEEGGLAAEIADCVATMIKLTVPTVSVLLGQGAGGGALALLPARRVIAAEYAWLAPLPPEGASAILHQSPDRAPDFARSQRIRAIDLLNDGVVHVVVPEEPPAHEDPEGFCRNMAIECVRQFELQRH
jgi:acetyl-CoA carboxylase alpha subunit